MISEKVISILGLVFVTSFVAKYVGPDIYGQIAFANSLFQIIQIISLLGSDVLIFKRLSKKERSGVNLIVSTYPIRLKVYLFCSFPILTYSYFTTATDSFIYIVAVCIACLIYSLDVYNIFYDAKLKSKVNVFINIFGLCVSLFIRWCIAYFEMDPLYLCIPIVLTPLIPYFIRLLHFRMHNVFPTLRPKYKWKYKRYLLRIGFNFVITNISVALYTRFSLLAIGLFLSKSYVGVYSVAVTLATAWIFINSAITTSCLPMIFSEKDDRVCINKIAVVNRYIIFVSLPIMLLFIFFGKWFITYFYGADYIDAYIPLVILTFTTMIGSLGTLSARYIAKHSGYTYLSRKMFIVAVFSIIVSCLLINSIGIIGAAVSSLLTEIFSLTICNYFFRNQAVLCIHLRTLGIYKNITT